MEDYKDLKIWNKSRCLLLALYKLTETCPNHESHGLTNQLRNSCVQMLVNITRGFARERHDEMACYLRSSKGSVLKLSSQIQKAHDCYLLNNSDYQYLMKETNEIKSMLSSCIQTLNSNG